MSLKDLYGRGRDSSYILQKVKTEKVLSDFVG